MQKEAKKQNVRAGRALGKQSPAPLPVVNVNVGSHANLQIVDLSTKVNIQQSHSEEVLFEQHKNAYLANPGAFM